MKRKEKYIKELEDSINVVLKELINKVEKLSYINRINSESLLDIKINMLNNRGVGCKAVIINDDKEKNKGVIVKFFRIGGRAICLLYKKGKYLEIEINKTTMLKIKDVYKDCWSNPLNDVWDNY